MSTSCRTMSSMENFDVRFMALSLKIEALQNNVDDATGENKKSLQARLDQVTDERNALEEMVDQIESDYSALFATAQSGAELTVKTVERMAQETVMPYV